MLSPASGVRPLPGHGCVGVGTGCTSSPGAATTARTAWSRAASPAARRSWAGPSSAAAGPGRCWAGRWAARGAAGPHGARPRGSRAGVAGREAGPTGVPAGRDGRRTAVRPRRSDAVAPARVRADGRGLAGGLGVRRPGLAALAGQLGGRLDRRLVRRRALAEVVEGGDPRPLLHLAEDPLQVDPGQRLLLEELEHQPVQDVAVVEDLPRLVVRGLDERCGPPRRSRRDLDGVVGLVAHRGRGTARPARGRSGSRRAARSCRTR